MSHKQPYRNVMIFSGVVVALMFLLSLIAWQQIPTGALVPTHWGINGQADQYGSKTVGLLMMPIVTSLIVLLFRVIPRIEPRKANLAASQKAYQVLWVFMVLFFAGMHLSLLLSTLGYAIDVMRFVLLMVGMLFLVIGNYSGKIQSNYMFGVRTPWTLASDRAWYKTHRLAGKLFFALGILFIVLPFVFDPASVLIYGLGLMLIGVVAIFFYSYTVWKNDPNAREKAKSA